MFTSLESWCPRMFFWSFYRIIGHIEKAALQKSLLGHKRRHISTKVDSKYNWSILLMPHSLFVCLFVTNPLLPVDVVYCGSMWVKKCSVLYLSPQNPDFIFLSFCRPPLLPSSFLSWTLSSSPSLCCSFPLTFICLLFFLCRCRSVRLVSKLIQPSKSYERAERHKTWLWPDVRIISCIIQIIR